MIEPELFQLPCLYSNNVMLHFNPYSNIDLGMDDIVHHEPNFDFHHCTPLSPTSYSSLSNDQLVNFAANVGTANVTSPLEEYSSQVDFEELKLIWRHEIENINNYSECKREEWSVSPSPVLSDDMSVADETFMLHQQPPLKLPTEGIETDHQLSLNHLFQAYKEAMENTEIELAEVILGRIAEKVTLIGGISERLLYYMSHPLEKQQLEYLNQECGKISDKALEVFYKTFPHGMFAHFAANSAILEAKPGDAEVLHIIDFDMGEGVQWSSMIMALGQQQIKELMRQRDYHCHMMTLKITAIKWKEEDFGLASSSWRRFEDTKRQLQGYANSLGLLLEVREMELIDLVGEIKRMRNKGGRREWLAFNCMWALPHLGRRRSRRHVLEFLIVAKDLLASGVNTNSRSGGIVTFGDGSAWDMVKSINPPRFGSFFEGYMRHYQALMESIEWNFPLRLAEARMAMECLFVAPYVSSRAWKQNWAEIEEGYDLKIECIFEGKRMSNESLTEAKELVREGETQYVARIEGKDSNEMVLDWRGTPLVRVSAWI
ncbi:hypothetical protein Tsubulata_017898 [Turnera subulata]|uniref:Uncharacterized protein n=1 Tax=Turnera subulata TaxID=218843 RepID=A0A9Q0F3S7_9ROSI|nr:hypothetical protein Tsubulata_017898 [Turnera subulata]